ncbi:MAG: lytic murein transglycosylase [Parvibaculum sp.]|uniref:lytic murein transglycosylase n=1 Tax=Parvibaculum sp. TaxID=2024848 RepID=UPI00283AC8D3|nr:lytic murein transglycosylase [Parvibaculum sp.]MDR3499427.1 lytic murein transglycosylase [Parvibaculum sp.]
MTTPFPRRRLTQLTVGGAMTLLGLLLSGCADARTTLRTPENRVPLSAPVNANGERFADWLTAFRLDAMKAGIKGGTFNRALDGVTPDADVVAADQNQPEFTRPVWDYLNSALSDKRIQRGKAALIENKALLGRIEKAYGVDRHILVSVWALESNFGDFMGSQNVVRSLATLGFEGRRPDYGRTQLIAALKIIQAGDIQPEEMTGSWAGAMGQTQFIPTTYLAHAVDFDGDGKRDIWHSTADTLASTAQYLQSSGWETGGRWGYEVTMPVGFDYALADMAITKTVSEWEKLGLKRADGRRFGATDEEAKASLLLPAGYKGPAFLVLKNFRAILVYNNSTSYALAASLLADRFRDMGEIRGRWPTEERVLTRTEREELQALLMSKGYDVGKPDGVIGYNTRKAIRSFQTSVGLPPDGFATVALLEKIRGK